MTFSLQQSLFSLTFNYLKQAIPSCDFKLRFSRCQIMTVVNPWTKVNHSTYQETTTKYSQHEYIYEAIFSDYALQVQVM